MTLPLQESTANASKAASQSPPAGWLLTFLSIAWILLWVGGCALLMFAEPRPSFVPVWLIMAPMISMMTGQLGLPMESTKSSALWHFIGGLLMTGFFMAITLVGEETLRENAQVWGFGLVTTALAYSVAISSFVIRWKRLPNKPERFAG